jgi:hypothetical protein
MMSVFLPSSRCTCFETGFEDDTTLAGDFSEVTSSNHRNRCGLGWKVIDVFPGDAQKIKKWHLI